MTGEAGTVKKRGASALSRLAFFAVITGPARPSFVMPGLDPGIHDEVQRTQMVSMDCRVKSGNDGKSC